MSDTITPGQAVNIPLTYSNATGTYTPGPNTFLQGITVENSDTSGGSSFTLSTDFLTLSGSITTPAGSIILTISYLPVGGSTPIVLGQLSINDGVITPPQPTEFVPTAVSFGTPVAA